jgi:hypothetical protein
MSSRRCFHAMQCPECGSHNTQSLEILYAQSVRTGYSGQRTISELGESVAPPTPDSEVLFPFAVGVMVTIVSAFSLPALLSAIPVEWSQGLLPYDIPVVVASVVLGVLVARSMQHLAIQHNRQYFDKDYDSWRRGVLCRRCGHQFRRRS